MRRRLFALPCLLGLLACSQASVFVLNSGGSYRLETVDDTQLPFPAAQTSTNNRLDLVSGTLDHVRLREVAPWAK